MNYIFSADFITQKNILPFRILKIAIQSLFSIEIDVECDPRFIGLQPEPVSSIGQ
jgi:hypothetical protein